VGKGNRGGGHVFYPKTAIGIWAELWDEWDKWDNGAVRLSDSRTSLDKSSFFPRFRIVICFKPFSSPLVSIVTPYFNTGLVFNETVDSVLAQTLTDWEWIIVDDGSQDAAAVEFLDEIVLKIKKSGFSVKMIRLPKNQGPSAARNAGVKSAAGEFIMLLDSDDLIETTCLEKMFWSLASRPELSFVDAWSVGFGAQTYHWKRGFCEGRLFLKENLTTSVMTMIRKEVYARVGGFDENRRAGLEDWDFWVKCAANGYWGDTIEEFLTKYRRRKTHSDRWADFNEESIRRFARSLGERYQNLTADNFPRPSRSEHSPCMPLNFAFPAIPQKQARGEKHLLMIVPHFEMGGADKWNFDLVNYLVKKRGWTVTLAATNKATHAWFDVFAELTRDIHVIANYVPLSDYPRYLLYLIGARRPDVVCVSNSHFSYAMLPLLRAYFPETTFVDYVHMEETDWRSGGYAMDSIRHGDSLSATGVTSKHLEEWMSARGKQRGKIKTVYINVDVEKWKHDDARNALLRNELKIPENAPVIIYACRFVKQKQPDVFAKTVKIVARRNPSVIFIAAGSGELAEIVKNLASCFPKNFRWLGGRTSEEIRDLFNIADICFLPSAMEGISLAFYEAMSMGVVPVGADVGGQSELVTPECGVLVNVPKEEQPEIYAEKIGALLETPRRLGEMKENARRRVETHFKIEQMGAAMISLFERAREETPNLPVMPISLARAYAEEVVEQFRLTALSDELYMNNNQFKQQFRNSSISPKISRVKRNILRFLMRRL
jgi:glycosyltransferase involved in cell wall biosynthesis/GT2 family glycosyltransferase